jgi:hypothetical protein
MSFFDALIPLVIGLLLVTRPQLFGKRGDSAEQSAKKTKRIRTIGYVLVAVSALYAVLAWVESVSHAHQ